tara:strand:+ start:387 stop:1046 length:660 start_codon:yes stop_codon:yes gene_type:complete
MATIKLTGFNTATARSTTGATTDTVVTDGSLTIGDANTDTIIVNAEFDSHLIPDDDDTYALGSAAKCWSTVYCTKVSSRSGLDFEGATAANENPLYSFLGKWDADTSTRTPAHWALWNGTPQDNNGYRIIQKLDQNHNNSYDIFYPNAQPSVGSIFKVQSANLNGSITSAVMEWGQPANEKTPSSSSDTGVKGEIAFDSNHLYVCVGTNSWKRIAWGSW